MGNITNGDMIRKMSDDRLAELLMNTYCAKYCKRPICNMVCSYKLEAEALKFIKSPVGTDDCDTSLETMVATCSDNLKSATEKYGLNIEVANDA